MPSISRQHPFPAQAARRRRELSVACGLALGPAAALGLGRFAYALLLPSMRGDLHWSFATAGAMNTANAVGYLAGALAAPMVARRCGARRSFVVGLGVTVVSLLATAGTGGTVALVALRALSGVSGAITFITGASIVAEVVSVSPPAGRPRFLASISPEAEQGSSRRALRSRCSCPPRAQRVVGDGVGCSWPRSESWLSA